MSVSYKKLWKLLIDKDMKKKDLEKAAGISNYDAVVLMGLFTFLFLGAEYLYVDVLSRHIREKIEINPKDPRYLKVVWGVGYKIDKG